ncbi:LLM class flavin-dependent oxidoreductase [Planococcus sp. APC 4015]|nr:LLM class flavin-dependent oxidoreductase [Planococcus sp. APC 4015]
MVRIGAIFNPYVNPPEVFRSSVQAAEEAGLPELWLWEDCFRQSGFAAASAALAWTDHLIVGIGISPMPLRNAAITAMEIATIERLFPGRFLPGLGHGVLDWMGQAGARVASPLTLMREYVPAVRSLLAGDEVTVVGRYVTLDAVQLASPPSAAPRVYAAAEGPKTLHLSGEVADGTVLDRHRTPDEIAVQVAAVRAERAGRDGAHDIVAYISAAFGAGGEERVRAEYPDRSADGRGLWGSPDDVAEGARAFFDAGVDSLVLLPVGDEPDLAGFYARAGEAARLVAG